MLNSYDVVIVGGGNAALCAAITAATAGCCQTKFNRSQITTITQIYEAQI